MNNNINNTNNNKHIKITPQCNWIVLPAYLSEYIVDI